MQITVTGVDRILKQLKRFDDMDTKLADIAKRLVEVGEPIIRAVHGRSNSVWSEPTENGYRIVAEGETILFIEFGAGDAAGREAAKYDAVPSVVRPGSWSETHARQYSTYGFWFFGGHYMTETPPHPAFYDAYEAMVKALPQIVNEVFQ